MVRIGPSKGGQNRIFNNNYKQWLLSVLQDVTRMAVGVGKKISREELERIASNDDKVFMVKSFEELAESLKFVKESICSKFYTKGVCFVRVKIGAEFKCPITSLTIIHGFLPYIACNLVKN